MGKSALPCTSDLSEEYHHRQRKRRFGNEKQQENSKNVGGANEASISGRSGSSDADSLSSVGLRERGRRNLTKRKHRDKSWSDGSDLVNERTRKHRRKFRSHEKVGSHSDIHKKSSYDSDLEHERTKKHGRKTSRLFKKENEKERRREKNQRHKDKRNRQKEKASKERGGPVQLSRYLGRSKDDLVRRSVISGKKIHLKVEKSKEDKLAETNRNELLKFLNASYD